MNYVKSCLIITMLLGIGYSQCDANGDGELNVQDIVIEVDCILSDCWDGPVCEDIDENGICDEFQGTVNDVDGNIYQTIQIGEQLWMAENLKVTHYNNGDEIPNITNNSEWGDLDQTETGAYGNYNNNPSNSEIYGRLYNWYVVDDERGLCMDGWHIPSDEEIMELEMFLGMSEEDANSVGYRGTDEGSKLAGNSDLWNGGNLEDNSEFGTSGFTVLPTGYRMPDDIGNYYSMGNYGYFWSSSEFDNGTVWHRKLSYQNSSSHRSYTYKNGGFSIRCLGD